MRAAPAITVLVLVTSCNNDDPLPPPATTDPTAPLVAPVLGAKAIPTASASAELVNPAPRRDGRALHPFCAAAFDEPMKAAIDERCSALDKQERIWKIFGDDARAVVARCQRAIADPERVTLDEKVATACGAKVAARVGEMAVDGSKALAAYSNFHEIPACKGLVVGKQAEGAPCTDPAQCVGGLTCRGLKDALTRGTCQKTAMQGQACDDYWSLDLAPGHAECAPGLGCVDKICVPLETNGSACDRWPICQSGHCAIEEGKMTGTCGPRRAVGARCSNERDCLSERCAEGNCAERLKAGAECGEHSDCLGRCNAKSGVCVSFCGSG